jgi:hypothetical protein
MSFDVLHICHKEIHRVFIATNCQFFYKVLIIKHLTKSVSGFNNGSVLTNFQFKFYDYFEIKLDPKPGTSVRIRIPDPEFFHSGSRIWIHSK